MARPPKMSSVIRLEGKSHRTKTELEQRKTGERALRTGIRFKEKEETRRNLVAHKEFLRLQKLFQAIENNDGLQENVINRYCVLYAECASDEEKRDILTAELSDLNDAIQSGEISEKDFYTQRTALISFINTYEKLILSKREMLFRIEKESLMTMASALRSVPKKVVENKDENEDMFG